MTIQSLQKICTSLGYNLVDISDVGDKMFTLDGFVITETDKPVLVRGIVERPHPTKKQRVRLSELGMNNRYCTKFWLTFFPILF